MKPDLGGYQLICETDVQLGDLLIRTDDDWHFASPHEVGAQIRFDGETVHCYRVYRKIECPKPTIESGRDQIVVGEPESGDVIKAVLDGSKPTNPKDLIGSGKLPLALVPLTGQAYEALSFLEGALKYGAFNWRVMGVKSSIYMSACFRHMAKWWNGEWADPKTKVPHLASAKACLNIILDAELMGLLTDDRPPANPKLIRFIDETGPEIVEYLRQLYKDENPKHWTINDCFIS